MDLGLGACLVGTFARGPLGPTFLPNICCAIFVDPFLMLASAPYKHDCKPLTFGLTFCHRFLASTMLNVLETAIGPQKVQVELAPFVPVLEHGGGGG